jgi:DNA-binding CsgD family transcriptional regulator
MKIELTNHHFLTSSNEVDEIIKPLKNFFGVTSFVYQKNFLDGSEIRLSNQPEWVAFYFEQELYKESIFEHAPNLYQKSHLLWASLPQHKSVLCKAREFNIDHGITFIEPQEDGCEFFFIGTTPGNIGILSSYLNHLDLLKRFLIYFREKAAPLIERAQRNRIVINDKAIQAPQLITNQQIDRNAFLTTLNKANFVFSPREIECINLLLSGYNLKMIAYELKISYRTVETHIQHIKEKSGCRTKAELVKFLSCSILFRNHPS